MKAAKFFKWLCIAMMLNGGSSSVLEADESGGGAAPYLRMGLGARALGMGNAATAASQGAAAAYWNPAALVNLECAGMASQTAFLGWERSWNFLNFCYPFPTNWGKSIAGISWINFSAGQDIEIRYDNRFEPEGSMKDNQNTFFTSLATEVLADLAVGINAKLLLHQLGEKAASGFGLDVGFWHHALPNLNWGCMFQDIYSGLNWDTEHVDHVPSVARLGLAMPLPEQGLILTADADLEFSPEKSVNLNHFEYHLGAEYLLLAGLNLRAGWNFNCWTLGMGYGFVISDLALVGLDYALASEQAKTAGASHVLSLQVSLLTLGAISSSPARRPNASPVPAVQPRLDQKQDNQPEEMIDTLEDEDDDF